MSEQDCSVFNFHQRINHKYFQNLHLFVFGFITSYCGLTRHESSAWRKRIHLIAGVISLMYMRRRRGSRLDACGTPLDTYAGWKKFPPELIKNDLFDEIKLKPVYWKFRETISIQVYNTNVSITPIIMLLSKSFKILLFKKKRQKSVEWFWWKPDW